MIVYVSCVFLLTIILCLFLFVVFLASTPSQLRNSSTGSFVHLSVFVFGSYSKTSKCTGAFERLCTYSFFTCLFCDFPYVFPLAFSSVYLSAARPFLCSC